MSSMEKLEIQRFIERNSDWEEILRGKPYCISVSRDSVFGRNLVMFKYSQVDSDFGIGLVRECRGLILDGDTLEPVCVPFFKFFNAGEPNADEIDWNTAWTSEKLDGSIIKVVRLGDGLLVSTNGTIDAFKAPVQDQIGFAGKTFGDLFSLGVERAHGDCCNSADVDSTGENHMEWLKSVLDEGFTYMFELTSPYNKVVVPWRDTRIHFIGCRNNSTFEEIRFFEHPVAKTFDTPRLFRLDSIEACRNAAEKLDGNHEGFVVCDGKFRRNKVKSALYCSLHHTKNNGVLSFERGVDIVRNGEIDEVLAYFPEFSVHLNGIRDDIDALSRRLSDAWDMFSRARDSLSTRGDMARFITDGNCFGKFSGVGFALLDGKVSSVREWLNSVPSCNLVRFLGYKE